MKEGRREGGRMKGGRVAENEELTPEGFACEEASGKEMR